MHIWLRTVLAALFLASPAAAKNEIAGEYDYFVLSLSWSPNWCALEGDARNSRALATISSWLPFLLPHNRTPAPTQHDR
jgi:ribonuclease I